MRIVTGKTGTPHVTSQQFRQFIEGTVGQGSYILNSAENLEPELVTNNKLKIRSGMMCHHGNLSVVEIGTYDEVTIPNGTQGMKRVILIANRYTRNEENGIEECEWHKFIGPSDPDEFKEVTSYTEGNLQDGDLVDDCPVFEIHQDGLNVTEIKKLLPIAPDIPTLNASLSELSEEKEPLQKRAYSGCYYKDGYDCFLHAADENAEDIIKNLPAAYRPRKAVTLSGWCYNENSSGWYPCIAGLRADGTWAYVSAINELGAAVPYYIYNTDQGVDRRAYFRLWLTGAWATNTNGA